MAERLASLYIKTDGTEYLAGLTHDVGWLFLAAYVPKQFSKIWDSKGSIADAENEFLPFSHANIGAAIASKSSFPVRAVDAILYHHRKTLMTASTVVDPSQNPLFLGIVMGVTDRLADACQLDLFARSTVTMPQLLASPEVVWLKNYGKKLDLERMAGEEIEKTQELFTTFFTDNP
jgi:hypothetical protein